MRTLYGIVFVIFSLGACVTEDETTPIPPQQDEEEATRGTLGEPAPVPVDLDEDELPDEGPEVPCFAGKNDHC